MNRWMSSMMSNVLMRSARLLIASILPVVMLIANALPCIGNQTNSTPIKPDKPMYDHFLFACANRLVLARVKPDGFELKNLYTKCDMGNDRWPLCVARGMLYMAGDGLFEIEIKTGQCRRIINEIENYDFDSGRLYYLAEQRDGNIIRVIDFRKGIRRDVATISKLEKIGDIAVSPDHKRLAYFGDTPEGGDFRLKVVDIETGKIEQSFQPIQYMQWIASSSYPFGAPFVWIDERTIILVRTDGPTGNDRELDLAVHRLATADAVTGTMKDMITLPGKPGISNVRLWLSMGSENAMISSSHAGKFRIDHKAGRLVAEIDVMIGEFRLVGGRRNGESGLDFAEALYDSRQAIEKGDGGIKLKVCPDLERIVWMTGEGDESFLRYYDVKNRSAQTVFTGRMGEVLVWFSGKDLEAPPEKPKVPSGWTAFASPAKSSP